VVKLAFSNLAAPGWTIDRTVEAVGEYGYDGLELRLLDGEPIDPLATDDETRRIVREALGPVPLVCLDTSIELAGEFGRSLPAALELARDWDAPLVRVFGGDVEDVDDVARRLAAPLELAEELGVAVALETHDHFASAARVGELLERVPSRSLAALWDLHHPHRVGESPQHVIAQLRERIALVHVKDALRTDDGWQLVPLGEGEVPVTESLAALRLAGYDGWVSVEWEKRWHPELAEPEVALPQHARSLR
jgi:sugar phosphate isomerase/epimerase